MLDTKTCEQIKEKLRAVYKDCEPSMTTIIYWFNGFKRSQIYVFDEGRPDSSIEVTTDDSVNKIHNIVLADSRVKIREITDITKIGHEKAIGEIGRKFL